MEYKAAIGILSLDVPLVSGTTPDNPPLRTIPGTLENDKTFNFPLKRVVVPGATSERVMKRDVEITHFVEAAKRLEQQGVKAIVGGCGFMGSYQQEVSNVVGIPVFLSTLIMVPLVYKMLPENRKVGILTIDSNWLTERHFNAVGWSSRDIPVKVVGVEGISSWEARKYKRQSDAGQMEMELLQRVTDFTSNNADIGAIVVECTLMPPYVPSLRRATKLPIFDITDVTRFIYDTVCQMD